VLKAPYPADKARLIVREMTDGLALELVKKGLATDQVVLTVVYDIENMALAEIRSRYNGPIALDYYGREAPKPAHGSINLDGYTSSSKQIVNAAMKLYDRIVNPILLVRRIYVVCNNVKDEEAIEAGRAMAAVQLDMFTDYAALERRAQEERAARERERRQQETILAIKEKWGRNAILKGMSFEDGATARERNELVGGHKA
jgi:DNA polymerase V